MFQDEKAYEEIMRSHFPAVKRFLIMKLPSVQDAEDAFSTTALRVWNYLCSARVESVSGLIFTIARAVVAEFYRNQKLATVSYDQDEAVVDYASDSGSGAEGIVQEIDQSILRQLINSLPEQDANSIRWRYLDGLSVKEIAKLLNKSEGATATAIYRSRLKLKELILKQHDR